MKTSDFIAHLVTEKLISRDPHVMQRVSDLVNENLSEPVILGALTDEDLADLLKRREDAKREAAAKAQEEAEAKAKADAEEAEAQKAASAAANAAKEKQDKLNAIAAAAAHAVASVLAGQETSAADPTEGTDTTTSVSA